MTESTKLGGISPFFIATDVPGSITFYCHRLGFETRFSEPADDPFFAIVGRDGVQIFLKEVEVSGIPNPIRDPAALWDAFVYVSNPDALAAEFADRGLTLHSEITNRSDGLRGFEVADPDGYVLFFGRPHLEEAK